MAKKTKQNKIEIIETKDNLTKTPQTEEMKSSSEVFVVETDGTIKEEQNKESGALVPVNEEQQTKKKKKKKPLKKTSWKRRAFNLATTCVLGIVTGCVLGSWYYNTTLKPQVDYPTDEVIATLQDDIDDVLASALGRTLSDSEKENWVDIAKSQGLTPADLTASQNAQLALFNITFADSYSAIGHGKCATIATQTVYGEITFDGQTYSATQISLGTFAKIAVRSQMDKDNQGLITQVRGSNITETSADWTGTPQSYTQADFIAMAGGLPSTVHPYIITSKTILDEQSVVVNQISGENGETLYSFTVNLDPINSVALYVRQMKMVSQLGSYPEFSDVQNTFIIDENWNLVQIDVLEHYTQIAMGVKASCEGTLSTLFEINGKME